MQMLTKKIFTLILILFTIILVSSYSYADDTKVELSLSELINDARSFTSKGDTVENTISVENLKNTSNYIFRILTVIGIITALIVGVVLGIQFLLASVEAKAEFREKIVAYLVGCLIVFIPFTIWKVAVNTGQTIFDGKSADGTYNTWIKELQHTSNVKRLVNIIEKYEDEYGREYAIKFSIDNLPPDTVRSIAEYVYSLYPYSEPKLLDLFENLELIPGYSSASLTYAESVCMDAGLYDTKSNGEIVVYTPTMNIMRDVIQYLVEICPPT